MTREELIQNIVEKELDEWGLQDLISMSRSYRMDFLSKEPQASLKALAEHYSIEYNEYDATDD